MKTQHIISEKEKEDFDEFKKYKEVKEIEHTSRIIEVVAVLVFVIIMMLVTYWFGYESGQGQAYWEFILNSDTYCTN